MALVRMNSTRPCTEDSEAMDTAVMVAMEDTVDTVDTGKDFNNEI